MSSLAVNNAAVGEVTGLTCRTNGDCPKEEPICITADERPTSGKLDPDQKEPLFGNAPRACQPSYFRYQHIYTCSKLETQLSTPPPYVVAYNSAKLTDADRKRLSQLGYTAEDTPYVCKFVPRVQALDNWGWCSGGCLDSNGDGNVDYGDGCYDGQSNNCDPASNPTFPHWIKYNGSIIVVPS